MSNSLVFPIPIIAGQRVTADDFNNLDLGQYRAFARTGNTSLLADTAFVGAGHLLQFVLFDDAASKVEFLLGDQDLVFNTAFGAGSVSVPADRLKLTGSGLLPIPASQLSLTGASGWPVLATRTLTDFAVDQEWHYDGTEWDSNGLGFGVLTMVGSTLVTASARLRLPMGMTLTSVKLEVRGNLSGATMPTSMPGFVLSRFVAGAYGTATQTIGTAVDTSVNQATFEADHTIVLSGLSHVVLNTSDYILSFLSPDGGNTDTGFRIYRAFVTGTLATLRTA